MLVIGENREAVSRRDFKRAMRIDFPGARITSEVGFLRLGERLPSSDWPQRQPRLPHNPGYSRKPHQEKVGIKQVRELQIKIHNDARDLEIYPPGFQSFHDHGESHPYAKCKNLTGHC